MGPGLIERCQRGSSSHAGGGRAQSRGGLGKLSSCPNLGMAHRRKVIKALRVGNRWNRSPVATGRHRQAHRDRTPRRDGPALRGTSGIRTLEEDGSRRCVGRNLGRTRPPRRLGGPATSTSHPPAPHGPMCRSTGPGLGARTDHLVPRVRKGEGSARYRAGVPQREICLSRSAAPTPVTSTIRKPSRSCEERDLLRQRGRYLLLFELAPTHRLTYLKWRGICDIMS